MIPEDIRQKAMKLTSWTFGSTDDKDVMEIAAALLAERQSQARKDAEIAEARIVLARTLAPEAAAAVFVALPDAIRTAASLP